MVRDTRREQQASMSILASDYRRWLSHPHEILLSQIVSILLILPRFGRREDKSLTLQT